MVDSTDAYPLRQLVVCCRDEVRVERKPTKNRLKQKLLMLRLLLVLGVGEKPAIFDSLYS